MAQYKSTATNDLLVSVTNGSAVVTSSGSTDTTFTASGVSAGDIFTVVGDNAWYEVASVDSETQITLSANYAGTTNSVASFAITKDFTPRLGLPYPQKGDIETASLLKRALTEIDNNTNTATSNMSATTAPTVNDDADDGYSVGSQWIDTTNNEAYLCVNATAGAAVWLHTTTENGSEISGTIDGGTF